VGFGHLPGLNPSGSIHDLPQHGTRPDGLARYHDIQEPRAFALLSNTMADSIIILEILIINIVKLNHPDEPLDIGSENQKPPVIFGTKFLDIGPEGPKADRDVNPLPMKVMAQTGLLQKCQLISRIDQPNLDPGGTI